MDDSLKEYRKSTEETFQKSQDDFEKQLSFISAGSLGLSIFFIEKVIKDVSTTNYKWILITSWLLLGITLCVNLLSHFLSTQYNYQNLKEIDNGKYDQSKSDCRNNIIIGINKTTLVTLFGGIILLIIFISLNI